MSNNGLVTLATISNENRPRDDRFLFDPTHPLDLAYGVGDCWYMRGTSVTGNVLMHRWRQVRPDTHSADPDRYDGIEWTDDADTALDRLLELERRRRAAARENP